MSALKSLLAFQLSPRGWRAVLIFVALVQLCSAAVFLVSVRKQVFDESMYEPDVARYERQGITIASIKAHENPSGAGMPILASLGGRLASSSVVARRVPIFIAWVVAVALLIALARRRPEDAVMPMAGTLLLAFPHTTLSMATLLSEGPAVACVLGALYTSGLAASSSQQPAPRTSALWAGLCVGAALCFRQYYLALVPAFALAWWKAPDRWQRWILFAIGPVLVLGAYFVLWGGLTSAAARAGATFGRDYKAYVGVNLARPLSALAFIGAYAAPLVPWGDRTRISRRDLGIIMALAGVFAGFIHLRAEPVWGGGPLLTIITGVGRVRPMAGALADWLVLTAALSAILLLVHVTWRGKQAGAPLDVLCAAFLVGFLVEQFGVGGNIPYYERYAQQTMFFASALVVLRAPPRAVRALIFIAVLLAASQWILWRNA